MQNQWLPTPSNPLHSLVLPVYLCAKRGGEPGRIRDVGVILLVGSRVDDGDCRCQVFRKTVGDDESACPGSDDDVVERFGLCPFVIANEKNDELGFEELHVDV